MELAARVDLVGVRSVVRVGEQVAVKQVAVKQVAAGRVTIAIIARRFWHGIDGGEHTEVSLTGQLNGAFRNFDGRGAAWLIARASGLTNRIGQGFEVITGRLERIGIRRDAHDLPADRGRESLTVCCTQVVAVRLGICGEWTQHRGGICVDIGQRRHRCTIAGRF